MTPGGLDAEEQVYEHQIIAILKPAEAGRAVMERRECRSFASSGRREAITATRDIGIDISHHT
jgi:hypothetical protein